MRKIFLSAGHADSDPGAVANGVKESQLALQLRDALAVELLRRSITSQTDGTSGQNLPLRDAVAIAEKNPEGINIEFHFNAASPGVSGVEVLSQPKHKQWAQMFAQAISEVTGSPLRGDRGWKPENAEQHHRLAFVRADGLIVEVCFITSLKDLAAYQKNFQRVVESLALTIAAIVNPPNWDAEAAAVENPKSWVEAVPAVAPAPVAELPLQQPAVLPRTVTEKVLGSDQKTTWLGVVCGLGAVLTKPPLRDGFIGLALALLGRFTNELNKRKQP